MDNNMKSTVTKFSKAFLLLFFSAMLISACTLGDVSDELNNDELTVEEMEEASQILGQSLSDDNDGVFSSINDALSDVSSDGFSSNGRFKQHGDDHGPGNGHLNPNRGNERNYDYSYNPETGIHTISFERILDNENVQKNVSAVMTYLFTDMDGQFIEEPRKNYELIENIDFTSSKTGSMKNRHKESEFSRADTFSISGVSNSTSILQIDGNHYDNGTYHGVRGNGDTFERTYVNQINFLDIQIDKNLAEQNGSLEEGVTGVLTYEMTLYKNNNGEENTKTTSGTIEMAGDGTALLRFEDITKLFRVHLGSGIVTDDDAELEANVVSIDIENQTVVLENDLRVIITERTDIEGDDGLESLEAVAQALDAGIRIEAEVEGYRNPQNPNEFIAEKIEFEADELDEVELEGLVASVDLENATVTLESGVVVKITEHTKIDGDLGLTTLAEISEALSLGTQITADIEGYQSQQDTNVLIAVEIEFEVIEDEDEEDEEDENDD